jgi:nitrite reductase/ring-hydroxylating ferredoxin subunit
MVAVGRLEDFPAGSSRVVDAKGRSVAIFNVDGSLFALRNRCLHNGGPIGEGWVRDGVVTCPWHWWRYEIATGERLGAPEMRLESFGVQVRGGEVLVDVPPLEPAPSMRELLLRHAREWTAEQQQTGGGSDAVR